MFARGTERIVLRLAFLESGVLVLETVNGATRSTFFREAETAITYQSELERRLVGDGWWLADFDGTARFGQAGR